MYSKEMFHKAKGCVVHVNSWFAYLFSDIMNKNKINTYPHFLHEL